MTTSGGWLTSAKPSPPRSVALVVLVVLVVLVLVLVLEVLMLVLVLVSVVASRRDVACQTASKTRLDSGTRSPPLLLIADLTTVVSHVIKGVVATVVYH
jgi:hypothetical protein